MPYKMYGIMHSLYILATLPSSHSNSATMQYYQNPPPPAYGLNKPGVQYYNVVETMTAAFNARYVSKSYV